MAVRLTIELEKVNDSELARLQKRLVDLRTEASRLEQSLDLTDLARNARASGQVLKDALDFRTVLQNTEKELRKQEQALLKTGDASEETVRKLEELRQKQSQLAEQQAEAAGRVDDAKVRVDAINAQISATISATEATDENRRSLEKLREEQEKLQRGSRKAIAQANVRDIRLETPDEAGAAAARKQASAEIIAEIRRQNEVRKQIESQRVSAEIAAAKEKSRGIITSIRAQHYQQKKAEQELTAWMAQQERERSDLEKAMIAQAKQDVKELNAWRKQQDRERTEAEKQEARERAAAAKKAEQEQADEKKRIDANRKQFIGDTIGQAKNQNARAGALAQVQSSTVRLENEDRSLTREIEGLREYAGASKEVQQALDALESRLEQVRDDLALNDRAMRSLSEGIDLTTTDFERLRDQLTRTGASQEQINRFDNAVQQLNNTLLNADTTKAVRENKNLREAARQAVKEIKAEEQAIRDLQKTAEKSKILANKQLVDIERLQQAREEAQRFADSIREADHPTQEMIDALRDYDKEVQKLTQDIEDLRKLQGQQADIARKDIDAADAALTNAEATGVLAGRTEELRQTQGRLGREMDNVDARAKKTGLREMFSNMVRGTKQTDALRGEQQYLAKALIDSAQAWFLNTRASNEAFNVAQRIFSQNLALQAGIIGVVAAGAALVGVIKGSNAVLRAQADVSEDAAIRLRRMEAATQDVKTAFVELANGGYFRFVTEDITAAQERLANFLSDLEDGQFWSGGAARETGSDMRLWIKELGREIGLVSDSTVQAELRARQELANHNRLRRNATHISREQQKAVRSIEQAEQDLRVVRRRAAFETLTNAEDIESARQRELALIYGASDADRKRTDEAVANLDLLRQKREQLVAQSVKEREDARKSLAETADAIAKQRTADDSTDNNQDLLDRLKEQDALAASLEEKERTRSELEASYREELIGVSAELDRQVQKRQAIIDNAKEDESISEKLKENEQETNRLLERESELKANLKGIDEQRRDAELQRRVQIKAALDAIREQRKELLALADLDRTNAQMRIAAETQIDELQKARQEAQEKYGADSEKAQKATNDLMSEYEDEIKKAKDQAEQLLNDISQLEEDGHGASEAAADMRDKYQEVLDVVRTLSDELLGLKVSAPNDVAKAEADQVKARIAAIEQALGQMREQGLTTPADQIRGRISEADVNREIQRGRAAKFDEMIQRDFSKIVEELGDKLGRDPTTREINREIESRRRGFMRQQVTDEERLGARRDLSSRFIDSLESQKAIGKETAEALRQQLETESKSLQTEIEIRDAIKELGKANAGTAGDKAEQAANAEGQQPIDAIGNPKGNPLGQGMAALNQGVGQNVQSQQQLGEATGQAFEAMSQAFAGVANGQQQMANFLVALAQQVAGQSNALQNTVAQTMSRGGAALRNVS